MLRTLTLTLLLAAAALGQTRPARQFLLRIEPLRKDFTLDNITDDERPILTAHVAYLTELFQKGTMTFAGQVFDPKGLFGIIIVNASDLEAATAILTGDPTIKSKLFRGEAIPFRTVFERRAAPAAAPTANPNP